MTYKGVSRALCGVTVSFSGDSDTVAFNIEIPTNGVYQMIFKLKDMVG